LTKTSKSLFCFVVIFALAGVVHVYAQNARTMNDSSFTIVLFPDIQNMTELYPRVWELMPNWIEDHKTLFNIQAVVGLGDNTNEPANFEMEEAQKGWNAIHETGIPYIVCIGNHDYDASLYSRGTVGSRSAGRFNDYFGVTRYLGRPWYGGSYQDSTQNSFITFSARSRQYLVLSLEFFPRSAVLAWAQGVIDAHPDAEVIVATHAYLNTDASRLRGADPASRDAYGLVNDSSCDAQQLWERFISVNNRIGLVVSGHRHDGQSSYSAYSVDVNTSGTLVNQLLVDYQDGVNGGNAYMMLLRFSASGDSVSAIPYSAYLDSFDSTGAFVMPWRAAANSRLDGGMSFSGVNSSHQFAALETARSFTPPFTILAQVTPTLAYDRPFELVLASADGRQEVSIGAHADATSRLLGVSAVSSVNADAVGTSSESVILTAAPAGAPYSLEVGIDASGMATLSATSQGQAGRASVQLSGKEQYHVLLVQRQGRPHVVGPNRAYWHWLKVLNNDDNRGTLFQDYFANDRSLNAGSWRINGAVATALAMRSADGVNSFVSPTIGFPSVVTGVTNEFQPSGFGLDQNYPNPFNPSTKIVYHLAQRGKVSLKIFDLLGREVAVLVDEVKDAGSFVVEWQASRISSGTYFCQFQSGGEFQTRKIILLR